MQCLAETDDCDLAAFGTRHSAMLAHKRIADCRLLINNQIVITAKRFVLLWAEQLRMIYYPRLSPKRNDRIDLCFISAIVRGHCSEPLDNRRGESWRCTERLVRRRSIHGPVNLHVTFGDEKKDLSNYLAYSRIQVLAVTDYCVSTAFGIWHSAVWCT